MKLKCIGTNLHHDPVYGNYITVGKEYEVIDAGIVSYRIVDDDGNLMTALLKDNPHGYDFEIVEDTNEKEEEPMTTTKENFVTVGETYKSLIGQEWTCIFVEGDLAWCKSGNESTAYVFNTDGTPVDLRTVPDTYTLVPNRKVVELFGNVFDWEAWGDITLAGDTHKITFELDSSGEPVLDSIKMEKL